MEKPVPAEDQPPPLTILHHDEHLVFPGYDVMVGKGWKGQDEEAGRDHSWTAQIDDVDEVDPAAEGQSSARVRWYQKHKRKLVVAAIICSLLVLVGIIAYISARPSPDSKSPAPSPGPTPAPAPAPAPASFEGIATFNDYNYQMKTQGSTVCGGSQSLPGELHCA
ncbi:MAG: hypothetical protein Q9224_000034 [Gallowayella concinna]